MMTLILIGGRTVAAHVAPDLAGEFPAGADAADGEGADLLVALFEALAGKGGRREEMGEPPHRLDRLAGEHPFDFDQVEVVVWGIHHPRIGPKRLPMAYEPPARSRSRPDP